MEWVAGMVAPRDSNYVIIILFLLKLGSFSMLSSPFSTIKRSPPKSACHTAYAFLFLAWEP